jgi:glyoxylase-like metal-dependent hydrolase (beta-lactamase superfamily II)
MEMLSEPMGRGYQTNCYILIKNGTSIIIDPGIDSEEWVVRNSPRPLAILNTHGHFDHTYADSYLQRELKIPVYIRKEDAYQLGHDHYDMKKEPCIADVLVSDEEWIVLGDFCFRFMHFPGHTPGCSMIEFEDRIFSGDFIFDDTVGKYDFPASSPSDMRRSLEKFMTLYGANGEDNRPLFPGHGTPTSVQEARAFVPSFIRILTS